jgi:hypothetical protein
VKLLNNPKLAQNVLKRLNKENETEPEPLNPGQPKLRNNDRRAYKKAEREPLIPGQPKLAGETSQQPEAHPERTETTEQRE